MNQNHLAALLERPDIQQRILKSYEGGYSLGLTADPEKTGELAIRVRIEGGDPACIPRQVVLEGETIPVIVNAGFKVPEPLGST
jgi:hypothetical protein